MPLTTHSFPPYVYQEYPKQVGNKIVYSQVEEDELLDAMEAVKESEEEGLDKEALQNQADELGVKWKANWSANRLQKAIEAAQE